MEKIKLLYRYLSGIIVCFFTGRTRKSKKRLKEYKNKYKGQRCFIIGNGPSLLSEDLDKLKNEVTFGSNGIYNAFGDTDWRPTYFAIFDESVAVREGMIDGVNTINCPKFVRLQGWYLYKHIKGDVIYVNSWFGRRYLDNPKFSEKVDKGVYTIATVKYTMIQLAKWMGFSEIYLLGMDNKYAYSIQRNGEIIKNDGVVNWFNQQNQKLPDKSNAVATWELDVAYEYAEKYSRQNGFRIYNATRGGFLEAFERVNLDDIL